MLSICGRPKPSAYTIQPSSLALSLASRLHPLNRKVRMATRAEIAATMSAMVALLFAPLAISSVSACAAFWRFDAFSSR
jgi:hypothetical protein